MYGEALSNSHEITVSLQRTGILKLNVYTWRCVAATLWQCKGGVSSMLDLADGKIRLQTFTLGPRTLRLA